GYTMSRDQRNTHAIRILSSRPRAVRPREARSTTRAEANPCSSLFKRVLRWVVALILIVVGVVLSIPGVPGPGILVILIGVCVLLPESRWLRKKYAALKQRYPKVFSPIEARRVRARHDRRRARRES